MKCQILFSGKHKKHIVNSSSAELVWCGLNTPLKKKVREKSRECHNYKPQPFPDPKRKRKPTNPNKHHKSHLSQYASFSKKLKLKLDFFETEINTRQPQLRGNERSFGLSKETILMYPAVVFRFQLLSFLKYSFYMFTV